jgi:hypothetical protein
MRFSWVLVLLLSVGTQAQNTPTKSTTPFPGTYEQLKPQQKLLIDDWYADYNKMMHENLPLSDYDQLSLSVRTTFEAVTHALMTTNLTDQSGKPLGNALSLVESIETINGKIPKARGDLQFRMYVVLQPNALQTLKDCKQFFRDRDNTVYHHGYPVNWRQDGGAPSIQISMAADGRHADVDVDYRSSKFPAALINGHLTAANSDVRAGNNTQRHLQRWEGLTDWWRNLFGLDIPEQNTVETAEATGDIPPVPRKGSGKLDGAVMDFLTSWLVEQKPGLSAAYLSSRSYACLEEYGPQAGTVINTSSAPYLAARDLAAINRSLGKPASLQSVVKIGTLDDSRLKLVKQQYGNIFTVYSVPDGVAPEFECDDQRALRDFENARITGKKNKYSRYYASVLRLKSSQGPGQLITLLWSKEGPYWKVISWDMESEDAKPQDIPDTRKAATAQVEEHATGDSAFLRASNDFLNVWLVKRDYAAATKYFAASSYACVDASSQPAQQSPGTPSQLRNAMSTLASNLDQAQHINEVLEPVDPEHPGLKLVDHPEQDAYTVVAVPDTLAPIFMCEKESRAHPYQPVDWEAQSSSYGKYYELLFEVRTPGDHPASMSFLWSKDKGQWKIVSYEMVSP